MNGREAFEDDGEGKRNSGGLERGEPRGERQFHKSLMANALPQVARVKLLA